MSSPADHEQLIAVDVDLRQLPVLQRVLDRQRVEIVEALQRVDLVGTRIGQPDPDELRTVGGAIDPFVDRDLANTTAMAVQIGGDDRHGCPDQRREADVQSIRARSGFRVSDFATNRACRDRPIRCRACIIEAPCRVLNARPCGVMGSSRRDRNALWARCSALRRREGAGLNSLAPWTRSSIPVLARMNVSRARPNSAACAGPCRAASNTLRWTNVDPPEHPSSTTPSNRGGSLPTSHAAFQRPIADEAQPSLDPLRYPRRRRNCNRCSSTPLRFGKTLCCLCR